MKLLYTAIGLLGSLIGFIPTVGAALPTVEEIRFRVLLDDKEIGYHTFTIASEGKAKVVKTKAEFDVRLFFIRAYNYLHENTETWRNGCLHRIDSLTDDNGKRFEVNGEKGKDSFKLVTLDTVRSLKQDCVMTFAYWDQDFLSQTRLLNAQTGDYVEVRTESLGQRRFEVGSGVILGQGFRVFSSDHDLSINVWYHENTNRWLALESAVGNGKTLRYLPVEINKILSSSSANEQGQNST